MLLDKHNQENLIRKDIDNFIYNENNLIMIKSNKN